MKYATKEIKEKIVRADQLIHKMKELDGKVSDVELSQKSMLEISNAILAKNIVERSDYAKKYEEFLQQLENASQKSVDDIQENSNNRDEIVSKLKRFRLEQSRNEKIKPYYIFNDAQMEDIISKNPKTKEELLQISGFGNIKVEKYGEAIIRILGE